MLDATPRVHCHNGQTVNAAEIPSSLMLGEKTGKALPRHQRTAADESAQLLNSMHVFELMSSCMLAKTAFVSFPFFPDVEVGGTWQLLFFCGFPAQWGVYGRLPSRHRRPQDLPLPSGRALETVEMDR